MCFVKHDKVVWKLRQNIVSNTITTVLHTREKKLYKSEKKKSFHEWLTLPVKWVFPFQVDQECSDSWRGGGWGSPKVYQAC